MSSSLNRSQECISYKTIPWEATWPRVIYGIPAVLWVDRAKRPNSFYLVRELPKYLYKLLLLRASSIYCMESSHIADWAFTKCQQTILCWRCVFVGQLKSLKWGEEIPMTAFVHFADWPAVKIPILFLCLLLKDQFNGFHIGLWSILSDVQSKYRTKL